MVWARVEIDLSDIDDDELEEEYKRRFKDEFLSIHERMQNALDLINTHYWNREQWEALQTAISNAMKYGMN